LRHPDTNSNPSEATWSTAKHNPIQLLQADTSFRKHLLHHRQQAFTVLLWADFVQADVVLS
jgi:hypothetical protein